MIETTSGAARAARVRYVVGFALTPAHDGVLLVRKTRPSHLAGLLNAIGGGVEYDDADLMSAMQREWSEEVAGVEVADWRELCTVTSPTSEVTFFVGHASADALQARHLTPNDAGEELTFRDLDGTEVQDATDDLAWLLPLAVRCGQAYRPFTVTVDA